jgi:hypothetical protein
MKPLYSSLYHCTHHCTFTHHSTHYCKFTHHCATVATAERRRDANRKPDAVCLPMKPLCSSLYHCSQLIAVLIAVLITVLITVFITVNLLITCEFLLITVIIMATAVRRWGANRKLDGVCLPMKPLYSSLYRCTHHCITVLVAVLITVNLLITVLL